VLQGGPQSQLTTKAIQRAQIALFVGAASSASSPQPLPRTAHPSPTTHGGVTQLYVPATTRARKLKRQDCLLLLETYRTRPAESTGGEVLHHALLQKRTSSWRPGYYRSEGRPTSDVPCGPRLKAGWILGPRRARPIDRLTSFYSSLRRSVTI
jgi:hypothetical protein